MSEDAQDQRRLRLELARTRQRYYQNLTEENHDRFQEAARAYRAVNKGRLI